MTSFKQETCRSRFASWTKESLANKLTEFSSPEQGGEWHDLPHAEVLTSSRNPTHKNHNPKTPTQNSDHRTTSGQPKNGGSGAKTPKNTRSTEHTQSNRPTRRSRHTAVCNPRSTHKIPTTKLQRTPKSGGADRERRHPRTPAPRNATLCRSSHRLTRRSIHTVRVTTD